MNKIVFFDLNIVGIKRYPLEIANAINSSITDHYFYFLYEEDPDNLYDTVLNKLPVNSELIKIKYPNYYHIKTILNKISPNSLLVMAQRIPDSAIVSIANQLNIRTYMFQHGLYVPFMKKNNKMFIKKIRKTIRYFLYLSVIAKTTNSNFFKIFLVYYKIFIKGSKMPNFNLDLSKINVNKVFVYGIYWKKYHLNEYGYDMNNQLIVGTPDLVRLKELEDKKTENAICYICQTLVEDDRLTREAMIHFLNILSNSIKEQRLYIKLHIRSDISLYDNLSKKSNVFLLKDSFPKCNKYIGHYSSMLALSMKITKNVFLWKFENHNEYPFYFSKNCMIQSNNSKDLLFFINKKEIAENDNKIDDFFHYNENPFDKIKLELIEKSPNIA